MGQIEFKTTDLEPALYIVSTPIGNLRDITIRALDVLNSVDIVACEDTRVSIKLLNAYGIKSKLFSYHEHNAQIAGQKILKDILDGKSVALISDAGTPLISDPGYNLVNEAKELSIKVIPVPGACAAITALVGSGFSTNEFYFVGFLPNKQKQRLARLEQLSKIEATMVFYESPNRLVKTLYDMKTIWGDKRKATICRELTKLYETFYTGCLDELCSKYDNIEHKLGEIVLLVEAVAPEKRVYNEAEIKEIAVECLKTMSSSKAASYISKLTEQPKNDIYKMLLNINED